jgi:phytoene/squalene synthetase
MSSDQPLSHAAEQVRRFDRERFVTALFAPPETRERLMVLYAFSLELAKVRDSVREPMAGMIRLQWWRDVLVGRRDEEAARHPVAGPLLALVRTQVLPVDLFEQVISAREQDLDPAPFVTQAARVAYAAATAGALHELAVMALGARDEASRMAARHMGAAWTSVGLLRAMPFHLSSGWLTLPGDLLAQAGITSGDVPAGRAPKPVLAAIARTIGEAARLDLGQARRHRVPRHALPALLPAVIVGAHLRALDRAGWDVFDTRVALPRPSPVRLALHSMVGRF